MRRVKLLRCQFGYSLCKWNVSIYRKVLINFFEHTFSKPRKPFCSEAADGNRRTSSINTEWLAIFLNLYFQKRMMVIQETDLTPSGKTPIVHSLPWWVETFYTSIKKKPVGIRALPCPTKAFLNLPFARSTLYPFTLPFARSTLPSVLNLKVLADISLWFRCVTSAIFRIGMYPCQLKYKLVDKLCPFAVALGSIWFYLHLKWRLVLEFLEQEIQRQTINETRFVSLRCVILWSSGGLPYKALTSLTTTPPPPPSHTHPRTRARTHAPPQREGNQVIKDEKLFVLFFYFLFIFYISVFTKILLQKI